MKPYYEDATVRLFHGDSLNVLRELPDASVDSVVTDPPYGLEFMGREWDSFKTRGNECATTEESAETSTATGVRDVENAGATTVSGVPRAGMSGGRQVRRDPARAASATTVDAAAVRGYQDGNGGNAFSRSRVRTSTIRHGGDGLVANSRFQAWCEEWATECLRVLKPGGHMLAFGGTRTWHRLACAVEDAGFEVRDSIAWLYGSGFPKSLDVSKAIDKAAGAEREVVGDKLDRPGYHLHGHSGGAAFGHGIASTTPETRLAAALITAPATPDAQYWQGWGTALKPAFEPVVVARKPLAGTVASNVVTHGTGALNVGGCRTGTQAQMPSKSGLTRAARGDFLAVGETTYERNDAGRWPPNVLLDESQAEALDAQSGQLTSGANPTQRRSDKFRDAYGDFKGQETCTPARGADSSGASRFFPTFRYEPKAPASERPRVNGVSHETVKPLDLMRWLVRLVTPPGGTVLEPFAGSGTTVEACILEGFKCLAIEKTEKYLPLIVQRINRRRDPIAYSILAGEDLGLFAIDEESA